MATAIQLNYTDPDTGENAPASYWVIGQLFIDRRNNLVVVDFDGYFSQAVKSGGKRASRGYRMTTTLADIGATLSTTLAALQAAILSTALTYVDVGTGIVFFQGGTIV